MKEDKVQSSPKSTVEVQMDVKDFDSILSYLSCVRGMDGAILYDRTGLIVARGEGTNNELMTSGPKVVETFRELNQSLTKGNNQPLEGQISYNSKKFHEIIDLAAADKFFLLVSGASGSHEIFRLRIKKATEAALALLTEKRYIEG